MKQRIVIRLHLAVRAVLQSEADWRGTRLGTCLLYTSDAADE